MGKLSVAKVKSVVTRGDSVRLSDGDGLQLFVDKAARPYWLFRARVNGKDVERSIGRADVLSLADARQKARDLRTELEAGAPTDGAATAARRTVPTFAAAAREHHATIAPTLSNLKHAAQWLSTLEAYVFPVFGDKLVSEVDEGDITAALLPIWGVKRETAGRVKQRIRAVLNAAKGRGYRSTAIDYDAIDAALPKVKKRVKHMAAVPYEEMPEFWRLLNASPSHPVVRSALAFLMFTAVRPGNVRSARWSDIDTENGIWTIPAELMKTRQIHRVPLVPAALAALKVAEAYRNPDFDLVFLGRDARSMMSENTLNHAVRAIRDDATSHGMRSAFKDWSLANGYPDHVSEIALAHTDPNSVRRAYARTDLLDQRREMMLDWSNFLTS